MSSSGLLWEMLSRSCTWTVGSVSYWPSVISYDGSILFSISCIDTNEYWPSPTIRSEFFLINNCGCSSYLLMIESLYPWVDSLQNELGLTFRLGTGCRQLYAKSLNIFDFCSDVFRFFFECIIDVGDLSRLLLIGALESKNWTFTSGLKDIRLSSSLCLTDLSSDLWGLRWSAIKRSSTMFRSSSSDLFRSLNRLWLKS